MRLTACVPLHKRKLCEFYDDLVSCRPVSNTDAAELATPAEPDDEQMVTATDIPTAGQVPIPEVEKVDISPLVASCQSSVSRMSPNVQDDRIILEAPVKSHEAVNTPLITLCC